MKIIPLNLTKKDYDLLKQEIIVDKITFVTSQELITKLLNRATYPIKNHSIAIYNILNFLSFVDNCLLSTDKTILPIPTGTFIKYFNRDQYHKYTELLVELEILVKVPYEDGKYYEFKKEKGQEKEKGGRCQQYRLYNNYPYQPNYSQQVQPAYVQYSYARQPIKNPSLRPQKRHNHSG
jgi:hypothetical protein